MSRWILHHPFHSVWIEPYLLNLKESIHWILFSTPCAFIYPGCIFVHPFPIGSSPDFWIPLVWEIGEKGSYLWNQPAWFIDLCPHPFPKITLGYASMCCLHLTCYNVTCQCSMVASAYQLRVFCHRLSSRKKSRYSFSTSLSSFSREVAKKRRNLTDQKSREGLIMYIISFFYSIGVY